MAKKINKRDSCKIDAHSLSQIRSQLPPIAENIIENCDDRECYTHIDYEPMLI
jgi:serine O-acetyltransferase